MTLKKIIFVTIIVGLTYYSAGAQNFTSLGTGMNRPILKLFSDTVKNKLYAGGEFATAGGIQSHCFAIWDGVSWDSTRNQFPYPPSTQVRAIEVFQNNIYAGGILGVMDTSGIQIGYGLARWDTTTALWEAFSVYGSVQSLYSDSLNLYIGGNFSNINNVQSHKIIRYDGTTFYSFPPLDTVMSGWAVSAIISYNNELYVGGNFDSQLASNMKDIAKWDGSQWYNVGLVPNNVVSDLAVLGNDLFISGGFKIMNGDTVNYIVKYNSITGFGDEVNIIRTLSVYPNPNNGYFTADYLLHPNQSGVISIFDSFGKLVYNQMVSPDSFRKQVVLDCNLSNGIYLCKLTTSEESQIVKFVMNQEH